MAWAIVTEKAMRRSQAELASIGKNDSPRPARMLAGYLCNINRGPSTVRTMMLSDIRRFTDLGADGYVSDLVRALHLFDRAYTETA